MKLVVVRAGSALLLNEFGTQHVKVGDVALFAARSPCGAEPEGSITTTTIYLDHDYVIDQIFGQFSILFADRPNTRDLFNAQCSMLTQIIRIGEGLAGKLMPWLDELTLLSVEGVQPERFLRAQALLFSTLDVIAPFLENNAISTNAERVRSDVRTSTRRQQFKPLRSEAKYAAQLLRDDPARQWSVLALAESVHLSPSQFRRVFVGSFGKAPIAYLTMVRIERMTQLLRSTELSIKQIATQVGWVDADFATRQFRRSLGVSPSIYRRLVHASGSEDAA